MDTSSSQFSEAEFEQLLAAASRSGRKLQALTEGREVPPPIVDAAIGGDDLQDVQKNSR